MKKSFAFTLITVLAICVSQVCQGEAKKNTNEANRLAREGAEAAKNQDCDKAVELLRKATSMDHKYSDELSAVYQRRGYAAASNQQFQDAINDYSEAAKLTPQDVRVYEQRAAVEMKYRIMTRRSPITPKSSSSSLTKSGISIIALISTS